MANEKKNVSEVETQETVVTDAVETAAKTEEVVEDISDEIVTDLRIERESFELGEGDEKKKCYDYFIRAVFTKKDGPKEIKVHLAPRDFGGYDVLDLMFDMFEDALQFRLCPWHIKAEKKGEKDSSGVSYVIASPVAPEKVRIKVKPAKDSDKATLEMYLYFQGYNQ